MNPIHEKIKACAYDLYIERNGKNGCELEDWLDAEKVVESGNAKSIEKKTKNSNRRQR